jgi:hypothetical protein
MTAEGKPGVAIWSTLPFHRHGRSPKEARRSLARRRRSQAARLPLRVGGAAAQRRRRADRSPDRRRKDDLGRPDPLAGRLRLSTDAPRAVSAIRRQGAPYSRSSNRSLTCAQTFEIRQEAEQAVFMCVERAPWPYTRSYNPQSCRLSASGRWPCRPGHRITDTMQVSNDADCIKVAVSPTSSAPTVLRACPDRLCLAAQC